MCIQQLLSTSNMTDWPFGDQSGFLNDNGPTSQNLLVHGKHFKQSDEALDHLGLSAQVSHGSYASMEVSELWSGSTLTIEALFIQEQRSEQTQIIVGKWEATTDKRCWALGTYNGQLQFLISHDGITSSVHNQFNIEQGKAYYAAIRFNNGSAMLYLKSLSDGTAIESSQIDTHQFIYNSSQPVTIGATNTSSSPWTGFIGRIRIHDVELAPFDLLYNPLQISQEKASGYKGIWFNLGKYSDFGPKYSGGLATYTVKHRPLAVYDAAANKTFFTYGGTTSASQNHLLIMASEYDHTRHTVSRPTIVMDKNGVTDPHDNASIQIDKEGYVYVLASGRNTSRLGYIYRSQLPHSVDSFVRTSPESGEDFTYPQLWCLPGTTTSGGELFFHMFTRYENGKRNLYFDTGPNVCSWKGAQKLTHLDGNYQTSNHFANKVGTAFNRHPVSVDYRTDIYYIQTIDQGVTWTTIDGQTLDLPIDEINSPARIIDYESQGTLVFVKDMVFDEDGHPVILYLTAKDSRPGPLGEPRLIQITRWDGTEWLTTHIPASATSNSSVIHNYASASIVIEDTQWTVIAPSGATPEPSSSQAEKEYYWGQGGEMEVWQSHDKGATWTKSKQVTHNSERKHGYARAAQNGQDPFSYFWCDGNPESQSEVHLYFGNKDGSHYYELPYDMNVSEVEPIKKSDINPMDSAKSPLFI